MSIQLIKWVEKINIQTYLTSCRFQIDNRVGLTFVSSNPDQPASLISTTAVAVR